MIISKKINYFQKLKLKKFKKNYISLYPDYLQEEINEKLFNGYTNNNDTINQIYCYLNIVNDKINSYKEFIKIIQKHFNKKKILEVGAGTIPILAKYLEIEKYNIDIIDPNIIFDNITKGKIINDYFDRKTDISNYDLIIGYNPCKATEDIIINSIESKKDFCIALCGCCFLPKSFKERSPKIWHNYLIDLAKKLGDDNYEIEFLYFNKNFKIEYPILIGKYKKYR